MRRDAIIIGGGAAGLMAGVRLKRAGVDCVIVEAQNRVGRKLLATGNGRCNLTNLNMSAEYYHGCISAAQHAIDRYPPEYVMEYFKSLGVLTVADACGRVYPASNQAASVLDALRLSYAEAGGETLADTRAKLVYEGGAFVSSGISAKFAIVCAGSPAQPKLGATSDGYDIFRTFGHEIVKPTPALTPIKTDIALTRSLKGVRVNCAASIGDMRETGEILFTDYGVSGIAAMQLSRYAKPGVEMHIDLTRGMDISLSERVIDMPNRRAEDFLTGIVPRAVGATLMKYANVPLAKRACELSDTELHAIYRVLADFRLSVTGTLGLEHAQVCSGGLSLADFDITTLKSKRLGGLYAAGEVLDVDGDCGGYNLNWAWISAMLAADSIIERLKK